MCYIRNKIPCKYLGIPIPIKQFILSYFFIQTYVICIVKATIELGCWNDDSKIKFTTKHTPVNVTTVV